MKSLFLPGLLSAVGLVLLAVNRVAWNPAAVWLRKSYWVGIGLSFALATYFAWFYKYSPDPDTRAYGWPFAVTMSPRGGPNGSWKTYVGEFLILTCPINFLGFLSVPSVAALTADRMSRDPLASD